ncbi:GTP cyclohydrolase 1 feedback regulatory protein-like [Dysidea avara]|uniref:GTP cyclohydrolase 1 feedback regulatory protein-like n=1 Tax=Dysidea avara TaxID=196820 RepID=UPI003333DFDE
MPYLLVSTQIRLENGPTICGDEWSDKKLMEYLGATLQTLSGNNFSEYRVAQPPRVVLNKLEGLGYRVISMGGVGQSCIWTMYCESPKEPWKTV